MEGNLNQEDGTSQKVAVKTMKCELTLIVLGVGSCFSIWCFIRPVMGDGAHMSGPLSSHRGRATIMNCSCPHRMFFSFLTFYLCIYYWSIVDLWASQVVLVVKKLPAVQETRVWSLGWEDPPGKGMATHSSTLAWRIPIDRRAWWAPVHGSQSQTCLSHWACTHTVGLQCFRRTAKWLSHIDIFLHILYTCQGGGSLPLHPS